MASMNSRHHEAFNEMRAERMARLGKSVPDTENTTEPVDHPSWKYFPASPGERGWRKRERVACLTCGYIYMLDAPAFIATEVPHGCDNLSDGWCMLCRDHFEVREMVPSEDGPMCLTCAKAAVPNTYPMEVTGWTAENWRTFLQNEFGDVMHMFYVEVFDESDEMIASADHLGFGAVADLADDLEALGVREIIKVRDVKSWELVVSTAPVDRVIGPLEHGDHLLVASGALGEVAEILPCSSCDLDILGMHFGDGDDDQCAICVHKQLEGMKFYDFTPSIAARDPAYAKQGYADYVHEVAMAAEEERRLRAAMAQAEQPRESAPNWLSNPAIEISRPESD